MLENLPKTLLGITRYFADPQVCIDFVAYLRWQGGDPVCVHCKEMGAYFLASRKIYKCKKCRKQFSVKMGTIFEESAVSLDKWLVAIWQIANCKNGISSYELGRGIGVTQRTAWFMNHRIRIAMEIGSIEIMRGPVEADETFIGGSLKNMHGQKRQKIAMKGGKEFKMAVFGMIERKGKVLAKVVPNVKGKTLMPIVEESILPCATVYTDEALQYKLLKNRYAHETINHCTEYVNGNIHTNSIENFWALLKRSIKGTYVSVSPEHLQKYVEEQVFRFNERKGNDRDRFLSVIESISGKRLTYKQLIDCEI